MDMLYMIRIFSRNARFIQFEQFRPWEFFLTLAVAFGFCGLLTCVLLRGFDCQTFDKSENLCWFPIDYKKNHSDAETSILLYYIDYTTMLSPV